MANFAARSCKNGSLRKKQGLRRYGRNVAQRRAGVWIGAVEQGKEPRAAVSFLHDVYAALQRVVFRGERAVLREPTRSIRPGRGWASPGVRSSSLLETSNVSRSSSAVRRRRAKPTYRSSAAPLDACR